MNERTVSPNDKTENVIVGVECFKCKQSPFGAYKDWWCYLYKKCGYCGEENAIRFKWEQSQKQNNKQQQQESN